MKNLKIFENFGQNVHTFVEDFKNKQMNIDLYDTPGDLRQGQVKAGQVTWTAEVIFNSRGIELERCGIKEMWMTIEVEDENDEYIEKEIVVPAGVFNAEQFKTEIYKFPLVLSIVEIRMRHSNDPEDWKIELSIGNMQD